jgi:hypothetical protein
MPKAVAYASVLFFVGGLATIGYGLTSISLNRPRKVTLVSVALLTVLGFFDGMIMKESFFASLRTPMLIVSVVVWICIGVLFALKLEGPGTGRKGWSPSGRAYDHYIYAAQFKFRHEQQEDISAFIIAGLLLGFPFLLVLVFV